MDSSKVFFALLLLTVAVLSGGEARRRARIGSVFDDVAKVNNGRHNRRNFSSEVSSQQQARFFPIFNVVTFKNSPCTGTDGDGGTCMAESECTGKTGADVDGSCAAGFGVCCVIRLSECGATITENCTYIQNPGYPSATTASGSCSFTIKQCSADICQLRLDYDRFDIRNADLAVGGSGGGCTFDSWAFTTPTGHNPPTICGVNDGQHMYVDAGFNNAGDISITGTFTGTTANRFWKVKVSQIPCGVLWSPQEDCVQYLTGVSGQVRSYNFGQTQRLEYYHLNDQRYRVCVRQEEGYCSIQWTASDDTLSFKTTLTDAITESRSGTTRCTTDYILIRGGHNGNGIQAACINPAGAFPNVDRFCGAALNCIDGQAISVPVYSSTVPFGFEVNFNNEDSPISAAGGAPNSNRGFCLNWRQIPC